MENVKISAVHNVEYVREIAVTDNGFKYLVIYGKHVSGGFFALPESGKCGGMGFPTDVNYNAERIGEALGDISIGRLLAKAIYADWNRSGSPDWSKKSSYRRPKQSRSIVKNTTP